MSGCCGTPASRLAGLDASAVRDQVRETYAGAARRASAHGSSCCGANGCSDPITADLYEPDDKNSVPQGAVSASLGCGNPTALADLVPGEIVLDLGSGGGIDVLLTAKRVAPGGRAYGIDMTDEMLDLARSHQAEAGIVNAEFIKGHIEDIPLPDESVDVVMSNCVINLSPEKHRVLREAFRVLRPGGRLAISDIVFREEPPPAVREAAGLWGACMGGALAESTYRVELSRAGFTEIEVEVTRQYGEELLEAYPELARANGDRNGVGLMAAFIRGKKPR